MEASFKHLQLDFHKRLPENKGKHIGKFITQQQTLESDLQLLLLLFLCNNDAVLLTK